MPSIISSIIFIVACFLAVAANAQIPASLGWHSLANTQLSAVCPNPASFPGIQGNTGCQAVTGAWSGGAYDSVNNRLLITGGGHADYAGNEVYALSLSGTPTMQRLNDPSTPVRDGCVNNGEYADGKPVARHWYNHLEYLPDQNELFGWGGSQWACGNGSSQTWVFNLTTLTWTRIVAGNAPASGFYRAIAYDPTNKLIYAHDDFVLKSFNRLTNTWTTRSASHPTGFNSKTGVIDTTRKRYYVMSIDATTLWWYDITAPTGNLTAQSAATTGCNGIINNDRTGWAYDPIQDRLVGWIGGNTVYLLNLTTFTCTTVSYSGGPAAEPNGTFGRFRYVPSLNIFVACNVWNVNCVALRLTNDFDVRCAAAGVIRCFSFDTTADFTTCSGGVNGCYGFNFGISPPGGGSDYTKAVRDTSVAANGASSLRFTIPTNSGGDMAGSWHANFSTDLATQFGGVGYPGGEFYIQWRNRFSSCYLKTGAAEPCTGPARAYAGGGGWKQVIIGTGDLAGNPASSCTVQEIPIQNSSHLGFPQAYHHCGDYLGFEPSFNNPNIPGGGNDDIYMTQNQRANPFCSFEHFVGGAVGGGYFPPGTGTCFPYYADEWMTFQIGITVGPYQSSGCVQPAWHSLPGSAMNPCYKNSRFRMWLQRENGAEELVADHTRDLRAGNEANGNNKYGKIWLLPYNTNKSAAESHPEAYTWYDSLIISTTKIAAAGQTSAPAAPSALRTGQITTSGRVTIQ